MRERERGQSYLHQTNNKIKKIRQYSVVVLRNKNN
jgi:hypothetical protein